MRGLWLWLALAAWAACGAACVAARAAPSSAGAGAGAAGAAGASAPREVEGAGFPEVFVEVEGVGPVRGFTRPSNRSVRQVHSFLGLPFVNKPPRFEPPRSFARWTEVHDGRVRARACPQGKFYPDELEGSRWGEAELGGAASWDWARAAPADDEDEDVPDEVKEDCLTLDVYAPEGALLNGTVGDANLLPVLLFFHGGAFVRGSSWNVKPDFILDHEGEAGMFVLVAAQYRLGPLGFLAGGGTTDAGAGNAGLHDQLWALEWTRAYVHAFGGDRNAIVIGGVSAGGATSGLLYVSPKANGLIQGALLFSGCAVSPWAVDPEPRRSSRGVAKFAGCGEAAARAAAAEAAEAAGRSTRAQTLAAEDELVGCLNEASVEDLLDATWYWAREEKKNGRVGMGGTIPVLDGEGGLLPRMPVEILTDRRPANTFRPLPIVVGITREEGLYLYVQIYAFYLEENKLLGDKRHLSQDIGEVILNFAGVEDELRVLGYNVQELYFHDGQLGNISTMSDGIIDFTGAAFFKAPGHYMAQLNADRGAPAWLYTFDYTAVQERALAREAKRKPRANHGSDQIYLYPARDEDFRYADQDLHMARQFSRMVVNFVRTLKPTPPGETRVEGAEWPPLTRDNDVYLGIGLDGWETRRGFTREYHVTNGAPLAAGPAPAPAAALAAALAALVAALRGARL